MELRFPRLLGDVGGTNARWAWQSADAAPFTNVRSLPCGAYAAIDDCIADYLRRAGLGLPRQAAFGIATALNGDRVE